MSIKIPTMNSIYKPNLLINGDFQVWQRGESFNYSVSNKYCADRWILSHGAYYNAMKVDRVDNGMKVALSSSSGSGGGVSQYVEGSKLETYTLSVSIDNVIYVLTATPNSNGTEISKAFTDFKLGIKWDVTLKCIRASLYFTTINKSYVINWAKLEIGDINTGITKNLYAFELQLCERYYQVYSYMTLRNMNNTLNVLYGGFPMRTMMYRKPTYYSVLQTTSGTDISSDLSDFYLNGNSIDYVQMKTTKADSIMIKDLKLDAEMYPS